MTEADSHVVGAHRACVSPLPDGANVTGAILMMDEVFEVVR